MSLAERLWAKVDRSAGDDEHACWPFTGYIGQNRGTGRGYGQIRDAAPSRKILKAHRVALILSSGEDKPEMDACHTCDNSVCCRPLHLFWGTHRENMKDYILKYGRVAVEKRPLPPRPRLPFDDVLDPIEQAASEACPSEGDVPF